MAPILRFITSSRSKKKELTYACLSEAKASHSHKMWTEVSSSVPHILHVALLLSPITYRCLIRVFCPVRRSITTLDCVMLKDSNCAFVAGLGPEISSQACLWVQRGPRHLAKCLLSTQHLILLLVAMVTNVSGVVPNVYGSSECNLLHVTLLVSAVLRQLLGF